MKGKLYGIGIGPGEADLLTIKAVKALQIADVLFVPKSIEQASTALNICSPFINEEAKVEALEFSMSQNIEQRMASRQQNADIVAKALDKGQNVIFLTLGDPMLYSTYSYILERLASNYHIESIPGIYSFSAISNALNMPLVKGNESLSVICHWGDKEMELLKQSDTTVCMKISAYYKQLYSFLSANKSYTFSMVTDVGKAEQKVFNNIDILKNKMPYFSTAIVHKKATLAQ